MHEPQSGAAIASRESPRSTGHPEYIIDAKKRLDARFLRDIIGKRLELTKKRPKLRPFWKTPRRLNDDPEKDTTLLAGTLNKNNSTMRPEMDVDTLENKSNNPLGTIWMSIPLMIRPVAQNTQRLHDGMMQSAWMKLSNMIKSPERVMLGIWVIKDEGFSLKLADLMTFKS
jgi:hypothetical protein